MQKLYSRNIVLIAFVVPVLLLAYQNCGQMSPVHEGSGSLSMGSNNGNPGRPTPPSYDDVNLDPIYDMNINNLRPAAASVWQSQCASCHGNRRVSNLDNLQSEVLAGSLFNHGSNGGKFTISQNNRTFSMPTGGATLSTSQLNDLNSWLSAVKAKKDALESDVSSCRDKTNLRYADIQTLFRQNNISYNGASVSCQSCHGSNNSVVPITNYNQTVALAIPRQPASSILIDALRPGTGEAPSNYHMAPSNTINSIANWIEGCMPN